MPFLKYNESADQNFKVSLEILFANHRHVLLIYPDGNIGCCQTLYLSIVG